MGGFSNDVVFSKNADFSSAGAVRGGESNGLFTDGQLWIGATSLNVGSTHVNVGTLTSPNGTVAIGYASPNITLQSGGAVATTYQENSGVAVPVANILNIFGTSTAAGTSPVSTLGAANTVTIQVQTSQAIAASDATKIGLAAFSNTDFAVDANGFVTIISGGFTWTDVTTATKALLAQNGYLTDRGGGVVYTLPASGAIGDEIRIVGKLGITTVTPNANQQILMSSASGTVGVTGTIVGTNVGDCVTLICTTSGASTIWRANDFVGNWTVN